MLDPSSHSGLDFPMPLYRMYPRLDRTDPETLSNLPEVHMVYLERKCSFGASSLLLPPHSPPHPASIPCLGCPSPEFSIWNTYGSQTD